MCLAGEALMQSLLAWSFSHGRWEQVDLCFNKKTDRGTVRNVSGEEIDIYQAVLPNLGAVWIIDEEKEEK